jgi:hypothetical protein
MSIIEKLELGRLLRKFVAVYKTRKSITVFTKAKQLILSCDW